MWKPLFAVIAFLSTGLFAAPTSKTRPQSLAAKVDAYVQPLVAGKNFSGCILMARNGRPLVDRCYGMANYELGARNTGATRFHIASVSKSFTAAAILLLEEHGKLKVEDELSKFISDYPRGDEITIHQLLTHTSGIPNVNNFPEYDRKSMQQLSLEQVIALFKDKPLDFAPGSKYAYSNSNYNLLAYIIEKISGTRYGEFMQKNFFEPLGMRKSGDDQDPQQLILERAAGYVPIGYDQLGNAPYLDWSIKTGNGSLYSTTHDLLKWDQALYGTTLLKAETINKMFQKQPTAFSYGWFVRERFGHRVEAINGRSPGFTSSLERFPDDHASVIITANTYSGLTQSMASDLAAILFNQPYKSMLPAQAVEAVAAELQSYEGSYEFGKDFTFNPGLKVEVRLSGGHLTMNSSRGENFLIPTGAGTFVDRLYGGAVSFGKAADGTPVLHWNFGEDYLARRTGR